jgi:hypothetical protein
MLSLINKLQTPLSLAMSKRTRLNKTEDLNYIGAFLTSARQKLLPYHSRSLQNYPTKVELTNIYNEIYKDMNELLIDEHETYANNDYLEQCYDILSNLHKIVRKYEIVYDLKLEENRKKFFANDPDQFPIYNLTGNDSEPDFKTIWELKKDFRDEFEEITGHFLSLKKSNIEHQDSGMGVFLSCKNRRFVLPGSLLGFYPGLFYFNYIPIFKPEVNGTLPYLKRNDGCWVDSTFKIPYPYKFGSSLEYWEDSEQHASADFGFSELKYNTIPLSYLNPLALGDKINHPPPDTAANVCFVDIYIPFHFFPLDFLRYVPNIVRLEYMNTIKNSLPKVLRAVGVIALEEIRDGDELYVDYINESMVPINYRPDWLLAPPPRNPYLVKSEYMTKPNFIDKAVRKIYLSTFGKEHQEFINYIRRDEGLDLIRANSNIKILQKELENQDLRLQSERENKKKIS